MIELERMCYIFQEPNGFLYTYNKLFTKWKKTKLSYISKIKAVALQFVQTDNK